MSAHIVAKEKWVSFPMEVRQIWRDQHRRRQMILFDWAGYLFLRSNKRGIHIERWFHVFGCRKWFNVARHTITNEIFDTSLPGETLRIDVSVKP